MMTNGSESGYGIGMYNVLPLTYGDSETRFPLNHETMIFKSCCSGGNIAVFLKMIIKPGG